MKYDVLFTGVGGEGVLTTSVVLARAANLDGYKVIGTQFHGLAQRGGSIPTHVRLGKNVFSPMISRGEADLLLALEPIEALRFAWYCSKENTKVIIDTYPVKPVYMNLFNEDYPSMKKIENMMKKVSKEVLMVNASNICKEKLGSPIYGNIMVLGVAISRGWLPIKKKSMINAIKKTVPRNLDKNLKAFEMGLKWK